MDFVKFVTLTALATMPLAAIAQTKAPAPDRVDQRQANQQQRIQAGQKSGQLTPKEAQRLQKDQARIQKMEDKARADGKVTKREARQIEHAQDRASKNIKRESHDKQRVKK